MAISPQSILLEDGYEVGGVCDARGGYAGKKGCFTARHDSGFGERIRMAS